MKKEGGCETRLLKKPFKLQPLFIEVINYKVRWMD